MFDFCLSVKASMKLDNFDSREHFCNFLDDISTDKEILSVDKVIYIFEDESFLFCDGDSVKARPAGSNKSEFMPI